MNRENGRRHESNATEDTADTRRLPSGGEGSVSGQYSSHTPLTTDRVRARPETVTDPLDDRHCRYLLYCIHLSGDSIGLPNAAHQVTVWTSPSAESVDPHRRLRTYMSLYHDVIPDLKEWNLVEYDQQSDVVELGPAAPDIRLRLQSRLRAEFDRLLSAEDTSRA